MIGEWCIPVTSLARDAIHAAMESHPGAIVAFLLPGSGGPALACAMKDGQVAPLSVSLFRLIPPAVSTELSRSCHGSWPHVWGLAEERVEAMAGLRKVVEYRWEDVAP